MFCVQFIRLALSIDCEELGYEEWPVFQNYGKQEAFNYNKQSCLHQKKCLQQNPKNETIKRFIAMTPSAIV
jgi:hypothetical protein